MAASSSSRPGLSPVLVIIILVALGGMIGLNAVSGRFTPKSDEEEADEQAKAAPAVTPAPAPTPMSVLHGPQELAAFSPGGFLADPKSLDEIKVGFSWTPTIQGNPVLLFGAIDQLVHNFPTARVNVVDADLDPSVPLGVSINGAVLVAPDPDGTLLISGPQMSALGQAWNFSQKRREAILHGPPPPDEPPAPPKHKAP